MPKKDAVLRVSVTSDSKTLTGEEEGSCEFAPGFVVLLAATSGSGGGGVVRRAKF